MAGQIEKRGEGVYRVRVFLGRDARGKRRYLSRTVHGRKKDAERLLARLLRQRDTGELVDPAAVTVDDFLRDWIEACRARGLRRRTVRDYEAVADRYIRPALGGEYVSRVTALSLARLYGALAARGLAPRTVRQVHEVSSNMLEAAVDAGLLAANPARSRVVRRAIPKAAPVERRTVRREELPAFLAACDADERWGALWLLLLLTGLRPEEALALRWADIMGDRLRVERVLVERAGVPLHFERPKSSASRRTVVLPAAVQDRLRAHRKCVATMRLSAGDRWKDEDLVFPNLMGRPLRRCVVAEAWKRFRARAGLPEMRLYDLRHSCATLLLEEGVPLKVVAEQLGHADEGLVLRTYGHTTPGMRAQAASALEKLSAG